MFIVKKEFFFITLEEKMIQADIKELSKESLEDIIFKLQEILSKEQKQELQKLVKKYKNKNGNKKQQPIQVRMSQELVDEKISQIQKWKEQIDEGEIMM